MYYNTGMKDQKYVKASELGDYVFCRRGWWLRFNEKLETTENMLQGTAGHNELAEDLRSFDRNKMIAWLLIVLGSLLIILYILLNVI